MTEIKMTSKLRRELYSIMNVYDNLQVHDLNFSGDLSSIKFKDIEKLVNNIKFDDELTNLHSKKKT